MKKPTLILAATLAACLSTFASAQSVNPPTVTVHFEDLDSASTAGAAALYHRIRGAAETVCRALDPGRSLELLPAYANCVHVAVSDAIAKVNRPALTAYAAAHGAFNNAAPVKVASR